MSHIEIAHNPCTVETTFLINGKALADGCKLSIYKESRLQLWVEKLFDELRSLFNGDDYFSITFRGVEPDYLDIEEAAINAIENGMHVDLQWIEVESTESQLERICALLEKIRKNPSFEKLIAESDEARQLINEALHRDFDVYVVAPMSAGKSTLINAMLGRDLLPAANEATTATIARITDNDTLHGQYSAKRYDRSGQLVGQEDHVSQETLKEWNQLSDTQLIDIEGNIVAIQERPSVRLVLTDTPGPNNSQDEEHQRATMGFIQDSTRNPLILYVLNASQLGINFDRNLLDLVAETMRKGGKQSKDRFIFVINKMDVFEPERGDDIPIVLELITRYLTSNGIQNPQIYPVSANLARLLRKPGELHTRKERGEFQAMADMFSEEPSMNLLQYMPITERVKRSLQEKRCSDLLLSSGLPAVEAMIDAYINKYNFPHRLKCAYDALTKVLEMGLNKAEQIEGEHLISHISEGIKALQQPRKKDFDTSTPKDKVTQEERDLPERRLQTVAFEQQTSAPNDLQQLATISACQHPLIEHDQQLGVVMNHIEITHNPFIVETTFLINGQAPADGCKLSSYKESRLQLWVEKLFDELSHLFNGDNRFKIVFKGVESDFLDIQEAACSATQDGMQVELEWLQTMPTEARLEQIRALMTEAREHPKFDQFIEENDEVRQSIEEAFNRDFDVYVVATMSSGKSTLINAMLGQDLLPAANEATTATIARITDNDTLNRQFTAKRYDHSGQLVGQEDQVSQKTLTEWNQLSDTQLIDIEGNIVAIQERPSVRLVLTDTPGPNNSQDEEHQRTTMGFIQDSKRNPLILYVLNATQLGTNDDRNLLGLVAEIMRKGGKQSKDRFIFVINKMDVFDPEKGEDIPSVLERVRQYLTNNGIQNPLIYPVSANLTRLIRKPNDQHTRSERGDHLKMADLFSEEPSMNLLQYMPITERVKRSLQEKHYSELLLSSGLPAVEAMIDEYIDKYNFPHRLKRAYDAMIRAIEVGLHEAELIEQLDQDERLLAHINEEIQALQQRQEKGFDTAAYKDKIEREGKSLPAETERQLVELEAAMEPLYRKLAERFSNNKVQVSTAEARILEAEELLQFQHKKLINSYEAFFDSAQKILHKDLHEEYQRYIADLFKDSEHLSLPVLEGIKKTTADISFNLSLKKNDIKEARVATGSREVKDSKWYNPFSWGKTKTVHEYGTENYVDLEALWRDRATRIEAQFSRMVQNARAEIEAGKNRLIEQFVAFMTREFDVKFAELLNSLSEKTMDRSAREQAIAEAKELHAWIEAFKSKLDKTLAI